MKTGEAVAVIGAVLVGVSGYLYLEYKGTEEYQYPTSVAVDGEKPPGEPRPEAMRSPRVRPTPEAPAPRPKKPRRTRRGDDVELAMQEDHTRDLRSLEYLRCGGDSDCVVVRQSCKDWTPVNLEHEGDALMIINRLEIRSKCVGHDGRHRGKGRCRDKICESAEKDDVNAPPRPRVRISYQTLRSPEFRQCQQDADCVVVRQGCKGWKPVNLEHKDRALRTILDFERLTSCAGHGTDKRLGKGRCVQNLCESGEKD